MARRIYGGRPGHDPTTLSIPLWIGDDTKYEYWRSIGRLSLLRTCAAGQSRADIFHFARPLIGAGGDQFAQALRGVGIPFQRFRETWRGKCAAPKPARAPAAVTGRTVSASKAEFAKQGARVRRASLSSSLSRPEKRLNEPLLHHIGAVGGIAGVEQHLAFFDGITLGADGKDAQRSGARDGGEWERAQGTRYRPRSSCRSAINA